MRYFLIFSLAMGLHACNKSVGPPACEDFTKAISNQEVGRTQDILQELMPDLHTAKYSRQTLQALADNLTQTCGFTADLICFDCIETNPAQSEIRVSFELDHQRLTKTMDVSKAANGYTVLLNIHD